MLRNATTRNAFAVAVVATLIGLVLAERVASQGFQLQPQAGQPQAQPQRGGGRANAREPYVSVFDFGANGRDDRWDSDSIQRAIDSLPRPAMPGTKEPAGGVVVLPAGRYVLDKPLRIFNGVTLRGEGAATVLYAPREAPAVLLTCPFTHGHIASAVVEDLSIVTETSQAIAVDPSATNIVQCRFENLILSPGGVAIELDPKRERRVYTQNSVVRNVHVARFGAAALTLWGNANHIEQINTEGGTRPGFKAEPAIVTVGGAYNDIRSCVIEGNAPHPAVGFHVSGNFTWSHNWAEVGPSKDGITYRFTDVEVAHIDYLHHVVPWHRAKFENCESVMIRTINLDGDLSGLAQSLELDERSNVRIDHVIARADAGMLDDPRVSIGSVFNNIGRYRIDFPLRGQPTKLLGADAQANGTDGWTARWDTPQGQIKGSIRMEAAPPPAATQLAGAAGAENAEAAARLAPGPPRLRVEVTENASKVHLGIEKAIDPPAELLGKRCVVTWRVEGPAQTVVNYYGQQIPSRAMGSLTANLLPVPAKKGDVLQFVIPPEPGVYYISEVALYPRN